MYRGMTSIGQRSLLLIQFNFNITVACMYSLPQQQWRDIIGSSMCAATVIFLLLFIADKVNWAII